MTATQVYLQIAVWSQVVSSIVFIGALVFMWFKWMLPVFMAAQARSNRAIAEAERHRDEVKAALETLHSEIETARQDAGLIVGRAKDRAQHERQALHDEAVEAGERALANAGRELERARTAARRQLREELFERALSLARGDAARRAGTALDTRLIARVADSLGRELRG
ncbi:MAG: ATP synthase F0 subunit B [Candidatus Eremiobacteraeota bacterium]|nr:ATP synthase F0 subunit B [Candidatus Eremiobacteraeota bacterium]